MKISTSLVDAFSSRMYFLRLGSQQLFGLEEVLLTKAMICFPCLGLDLLPLLEMEVLPWKEIISSLIAIGIL